MSELSEFQRDIAKTTDLPSDLALLAEATLGATADDPFRSFGLRARRPGEVASPYDTSYLNAEALADKDIVANVEAISLVADRARWVAVGDNGEAYGYWLDGREELEGSPIVKYDTEGQFELLPGSHLTEAVIADIVFDDLEEWEEITEPLAAAGLTFSVTDPADLSEQDVEADPTPRALHVRLAAERRAALGD